MSKQILEVLFESKIKVKVLKFLFRNIEKKFTTKELASRIQESREEVEQCVQRFSDIGLITIKNEQ